MDENKETFLQAVASFVKFTGLDSNEYLSSLESDYDTLLHLGLSFRGFMKSTARKEAWLAFGIPLAEEEFNGPTLYIMILKEAQKPILYYAYTLGAHHYSTEETNLERLLDKIIEEAKK